ncbi:MAG: phosphotransferase family protein [Anaerolineae bacterium]|nr:phosphotransferase family protein [Anaerolineae bacterium]
MTDETIDVRPDEHFDEAKLADYLRDKLEGADQPMTVRQFPGGAANLTYLLRFGAQEYVLRRPPLGPVAPKSHDMAREYKVLAVLHQKFSAAPRAYHFCEDSEVIGAPFLIMERHRGTVVRREMPDQFAEVPDAARQMSEALIDKLAELHAVDFDAIGLRDLGRPLGFVERQIEGWYERWEKAKVKEVPAFEEVYTWLKNNRPPENPPSLLHNDYKLDNVMFREPSKLVAIFDWDMCTLGDPLVDVGTLLAYWTEKEDPPYYQGLLGMPSPRYGFMTRRELVERYAEKSGRSLKHIKFYHVLALWRVVVIVAQIYVRYHRGQTQDERFAMLGELVPIIAQSAYELAVND